jgi:hypothetical protein
LFLDDESRFRTSDTFTVELVQGAGKIVKFLRYLDRHWADLVSAAV